MLIGKYMTVNELFEFFEVCAHSEKSVCRRVFAMAQNAQEQVVRSYSVAACPHGFFAGIIYDGVQLV